MVSTSGRVAAPVLSTSGLQTRRSSIAQTSRRMKRMFGISRRDLVLGTAGAYAAFGINGPVTFIGAAHAQGSVTQLFRKYRVGDIEVFSLIDGLRDVPLRDGMVRNVDVERVKAALGAAGFPNNQTPLRF